MLANSKMSSGMVRVLLKWLMGINIVEIGMKINGMEREFIIGERINGMVISTRESGEMI